MISEKLFSNATGQPNSPEFQLYQSKHEAIEPKTSFSMQEILDMDPNDLNKKVFKLEHDMEQSASRRRNLKACTMYEDLNEEIIPDFKYFQIKKTKTKIGATTRTTLQLMDLSADIFYNEMKAQEQYINMSNATLSHEVRNPLNQIMCQIAI